MNQILVIVDAQNDFLLPDGKLSISAKDKDTTSELRQRIAAYTRDFKGHVVLTRDTHGGGSCEFKLFPAHCIENSQGWEVVDEIKAVLQERTPFVVGEDVSISDKSYEYIQKSSYTSSTLEDLFDLIGYEKPEVHFAGVCSHICLNDVVTHLVNYVKEDYNQLPNVVVHKDLIGDFDSAMEEFALKRLQNLYGVKVV